MIQASYFRLLVGTLRFSQSNNQQALPSRLQKDDQILVCFLEPRCPPLKLYLQGWPENLIELYPNRHYLTIHQKRLVAPNSLWGAAITERDNAKTIEPTQLAI